MEILRRLRTVWTVALLLLAAVFVIGYNANHMQGALIIAAALVAAAFAFYAPGYRGKVSVLWLAVTVGAIGNIWGRPEYPANMAPDTALNSLMLWAAAMAVTHIVPWVIHGRSKT